ncbi:hypothetical protein [Pendulispora albinea]|uniref:Uncharacterized protein n=1 Tax=Pendulispora albinea TaxID=2741071 RepID=A0ABZ2LNA0_9BACT
MKTNPVPDGEQVDGASLSVSCTVKPEGDGYFVEASAQIQARQSFSIRGHFTSSGDQTNLLGTWYDRSTGTFQQSGCTGTIATTSSGPGIKAGAVWASVSCPRAELTGGANRFCEAKAEYRFENCTQE